ncbi:hypothetical protein OIU84_008664 [Salix udensis]|uniref:Proliferating cell nuclear antigen PCNA N-terminal domain-containing protein n=1 Tax=Salix udensis TaxID=889485 RepID=A0AAD6NXJ2_9ROSI|nr:hypothetical protein OIU84_008664 [Salix udensis]
MLELRLVQGSILKKVLESIKDLVNDANFAFMQGATFVNSEIVFRMLIISFNGFPAGSQTVPQFFTGLIPFVPRKEPVYVSSIFKFPWYHGIEDGCPVLSVGERNTRYKATFSWEISDSLLSLSSLSPSRWSATADFAEAISKMKPGLNSPKLSRLTRSKPYCSRGSRLDDVQDDGYRNYKFLKQNARLARKSRRRYLERQGTGMFSDQEVGQIHKIR